LLQHERSKPQQPNAMSSEEVAVILSEAIAQPPSPEVAAAQPQPQRWELLVRREESSASALPMDARLRSNDLSMLAGA
jgi:hypothetical protein